ncbi:hypothetical protein chiPu_0022529 [Chiloscyllium punctatum]|uniref:Uncharacterized protein n=1 Tax=Chiloscyllium punctatum TaxID=137246 RepID=A0A401RJJ2_CHIPU|nr:hypothetical protein [Chiloscyllium punctatum]
MISADTVLKISCSLLMTGIRVSMIFFFFSAFHLPRGLRLRRRRPLDLHLHSRSKLQPCPAHATATRVPIGYSRRPSRGGNPQRVGERPVHHCVPPTLVVLLEEAAVCHCLPLLIGRLALPAAVFR